ncbi:MAG: bifunctional 4-hydroxy-2-oxoglutarate aldolase/2-dehydro-3-deoxy-phosphogluconate aldolase [Acidobacteria bacterium]|nr:bifunctional 4-hydroxy-2-oxoglutarate aldolase/2-dehydro-3-deoxy-phosphogluconate aldolase [Acidobacteriota bacterium]
MRSTNSCVRHRSNLRPISTSRAASTNPYRCSRAPGGTRCGLRSGRSRDNLSPPQWTDHVEQHFLQTRARRCSYLDTRKPVNTARNLIVDQVSQAGVVAVIRLKDPDKLHAVIDAIAQGGIRAVEVTMTVPGAVELIRQLALTMPPELLLGAGTVVDRETAIRVIDSGAQFVVSPVFRTAVIEACHERGVPAMPGCFTPTEILDAWDAGADVVKVFPATALGPTFFKDVRGPLPHVKLMPTGGVTLDNAGDWIRAGAVAVGVGTALLDANAIASGDYATLRTNAERIVANVNSAR